MPVFASVAFLQLQRDQSKRLDGIIHHYFRQGTVCVDVFLEW